MTELELRGKAVAAKGLKFINSGCKDADAKLLLTMELQKVKEELKNAGNETQARFLQNIITDLIIGY